MGGQLVKCEVCEAIIDAGAKYRDHIAYHAKKSEEEKCIRAVQLANERGIYAVPSGHGSKVYWKARLPKGNDPDLGWLIQNEPTYRGWQSWADAVLALAEYQDSKES